jgi:hypothetical protein
VGGHRAGPPEDVGGIWSYNEIAAALGGDAEAPPLDDDMSQWLPPEFDPAALEREEVNRALDLLFLGDESAQVALPDH